MKIIKSFMMTILLLVVAIGVLKLISMISFSSIFYWLENNWMGILVGIIFSQIGFAISMKLQKNK